MKRTSLLLVLLALLACDQKPAPIPKPVEAAEPHVVRAPALAGRGWYPGTAEELAKKVDGLLAKAPKWEGDAPTALIVPHAGYNYAGPMQAAAYTSIRGHTYTRVFILAVPHCAAVDGVSIPAVTHYETPLGRIPLDRAAADRLLKSGGPFTSHQTAHREEHSVEIQLPYLQRILGDFFLVPMLVGTGPEASRAVALALSKELRPGDLVVVSSDSTHYGPSFNYRPFPCDEHVAENLKKLDLDAAQHILDFDLDGFINYKRDTGITICGFAPICVLLALLPPGTKAKLTGYDTSGAGLNDYTNSVSYVGIAFTGPAWGSTSRPKFRALTGEEQQFALKIARESMERFIRRGEIYDPEEAGLTIPDGLRPHAGSFVTLKIDGRLRGCIGDILPVRPLYQSILKRAISSAAEDTRFSRVKESELEKIHIEISVLTPPEKVESWKEIEIGKHGILFSFDGRRRSVYLPQVAPEQGWELEETLIHLGRKGGLESDAFMSPRASFEVFTAQVFKEDE